MTFSRWARERVKCSVEGEQKGVSMNGRKGGGGEHLVVRRRECLFMTALNDICLIVEKKILEGDY